MVIDRGQNCDDGFTFHSSWRRIGSEDRNSDARDRRCRKQTRCGRLAYADPRRSDWIARDDSVGIAIKQIFWGMSNCGWSHECPFTSDDRATAFSTGEFEFSAYFQFLETYGTGRNTTSVSWNWNHSRRSWAVPPDKARIEGSSLFSVDSTPHPVLSGPSPVKRDYRNVGRETKSPSSANTA
jgi:hypothetical protein